LAVCIFNESVVALQMKLSTPINSIKDVQKPGKLFIPFINIGGGGLARAAMSESSDTMTVSKTVSAGSVIVSGS
jgi:hypothetical protein